MIDTFNIFSALTLLAPLTSVFLHLFREQCVLVRCLLIVQAVADAQQLVKSCAGVHSAGE